MINNQTLAVLWLSLFKGALFGFFLYPMSTVRFPLFFKLIISVALALISFSSLNALTLKNSPNISVDWVNIYTVELLYSFVLILLINAFFWITSFGLQFITNYFGLTFVGDFNFSDAVEKIIFVIILLGMFFSGTFDALLWTYGKSFSVAYKAIPHDRLINFSYAYLLGLVSLFLKIIVPFVLVLLTSRLIWSYLSTALPTFVSPTFPGFGSVVFFLIVFCFVYEEIASLLYLSMVETMNEVITIVKIGGR